MWTEKQIEEADYYGISFFNRDGKKMVGDRCEVCHEIFEREATDELFPRYCLDCINEIPDLSLNEVRHKDKEE